MIQGPPEGWTARSLIAALKLLDPTTPVVKVYENAVEGWQ